MEYSLEEIQSVISQLSNFFDVVRLVNPTKRISYVLENGVLVKDSFVCHHVWHRGQRCENCISSRSLAKHCKYTKYEFVDNKIFQVVARFVEVDGEPYVLEIVDEIPDDVLIEAFGETDVVSQITNYNHQLYVDALTGVSNRRCLDDKFPIMLDECKQEGSTVGIAMIDIDDFKHVNDLHGHIQGDEVIKTVAKLLYRNFSSRHGDMVVRYGGDEFFIAVKDMPLTLFMTRLKYIQTCLSHVSEDVTISIGINYLSVVNSTNVKDIINDADKALYAIKATGKGGILVY